VLLIVSLQIAEPASNRDPSFCSRGAEDDLGLSLAFSLTSNTAIIQGPTSVYTRMDIRDIWTIFTWHRLAEGEVNIASRRRYARVIRTRDFISGLWASRTRGTRYHIRSSYSFLLPWGGSQSFAEFSILCQGISTCKVRAGARKHDYVGAVVISQMLQ
jgi:hypothetical protein